MKNTFKFKAIQRITGKLNRKRCAPNRRFAVPLLIIAIVAIIGFSMASYSAFAAEESQTKPEVGQIPANYLNTVWKYTTSGSSQQTYTITFGQSTTQFRFVSPLTKKDTITVYKAFSNDRPYSGFNLVFRTDMYNDYSERIHFKNDGSALRFGILNYVKQ